MNTLAALILAPLSAILIAFYVGGIQTTIDWLDEKSDRRKRRKALDEKIKFYTAVYANEVDECQKGYWLARIWNLQYERACLK